MEKVEKIIDVIINIPLKEWKNPKHTERYYITKIKGKEIRFELGHGQYQPSIQIDGESFFSKEKLYELKNRLNEFSDVEENRREERKINEIFNLFVE